MSWNKMNLRASVFYLLALTTGFVLQVVESQEALISDIDFKFTRQLYNVSIPENSVAKTYASPAPGEARVGIQITPGTLTDIRFKIVDGDRDKFFKAEDRIVGDFAFLFIRTRTGNNDVLNRERKDQYVLNVRATATKKDGKHKITLETDTVVSIDILNKCYYVLFSSANVHIQMNYSFPNWFTKSDPLFLLMLDSLRIIILYCGFDLITPRLIGWKINM